MSEYVLTRSAELGIFLEIGSPIRNGDSVAGLPLGFDGVLINGGFDEPEIVFYSRGLRSFASPKQPRDRERGKQGDYADNNHDFDQGKPCVSPRLRWSFY